MSNGVFVYYAIQHRWAEEGKWLELDSPLKNVRDENEWCFSSFDSFGHSFCPWHNKTTKNGKIKCSQWVPKHSKASDEIHSVWCRVGSKGWWKLKYAKRALKRAREDDKDGRYDTKDGYGTKHQVVRHDFRIVKVFYAEVFTTALECDLDAIKDGLVSEHAIFSG